jgi:hypothetical protein
MSEDWTHVRADLLCGPTSCADLVWYQSWPWSVLSHVRWSSTVWTVWRSGNSSCTRALSRTRAPERSTGRSQRWCIIGEVALGGASSWLGEVAGAPESRQRMGWCYPGDPPVTARSLHRSLQVVESGLLSELGTGNVRRKIAEVGELWGLVWMGIWGQLPFWAFGDVLKYWSRREWSGLGRELTYQSWLGCGVWGEYLAEKDCAVRSCLWDGVSVVIVWGGE